MICISHPFFPWLLDYNFTCTEIFLYVSYSLLIRSSHVISLIVQARIWYREAEGITNCWKVGLFTIETPARDLLHYIKTNKKHWHVDKWGQLTCLWSVWYSRHSHSLSASDAYFACTHTDACVRVKMILCWWSGPTLQEPSLFISTTPPLPTQLNLHWPKFYSSWIDIDYWICHL